MYIQFVKFIWVMLYFVKLGILIKILFVIYVVYWFIPFTCIVGSKSCFSSISVHKWKEHRRLLAHAFNAKFLEQFFPVFNEKTKILIENLKKEVGKTDTFDLRNNIAPNTLDEICREYNSYPIQWLKYVNEASGFSSA